MSHEWLAETNLPGLQNTEERNGIQCLQPLVPSWETKGQPLVPVTQSQATNLTLRAILIVCLQMGKSALSNKCHLQEGLKLSAKMTESKS
jgi:hypothetical protein